MFSLDDRAIQYPHAEVERVSVQSATLFQPPSANTKPSQHTTFSTPVSFLYSSSSYGPQLSNPEHIKFTYLSLAYSLASYSRLSLQTLSRMLLEDHDQISLQDVSLRRGLTSTNWSPLMCALKKAIISCTMGGGVSRADTAASHLVGWAIWRCMVKRVPPQKVANYMQFPCRADARIPTTNGLG